MNEIAESLQNIEIPVDRKAYVKYNVTKEELVAAWNASNTREEVLSRVQMPLNVVLARISYYKKKGDELKDIPRTKKVEVTA